MRDINTILKAIKSREQFYKTSEWRKTRALVLKIDHNECQLCKAKGKYKKATIVHHVKHFEDRPDLGLSIYDENGDRQLISVCDDCHEQEHISERQQYKKKDKVLTEEKW